MSFGVSAQRNLVLRGDASVPLGLCSGRLSEPALSFRGGSNSSLSPLDILCRRRFAFAQEAHSCQGIILDGRWDSNPILADLPEVAIQCATDGKLAEGSSENRALVLSQRKYLFSSPLSDQLLCGWICVGSSAYSNAQVTRSARRSPQR